MGRPMGLEGVLDFRNHTTPPRRYLDNDKLTKATQALRIWEVGVPAAISLASGDQEG